MPGSGVSTSGPAALRRVRRLRAPSLAPANRPSRPLHITALPPPRRSGRAGGSFVCSSSSSPAPFSLLRSFSSSLPPSRVRVVQSDEALRRVVRDAGDGLVVVDWSATWCGPCRVMAPVLDALSLSADNAGVAFVKADIDEMPDASAEAGVVSVPTFHLIKGGRLVGQLTGADETRLKDLIQRHR